MTLIKGEKRVAVFLTVIGATTYALLRNLVHPKKTATMKLKELTDSLEAHFMPKPLTIAERFKFHRRSQQSSESVAEYLAALRKLAGR